MHQFVFLSQPNDFKTMQFVFFLKCIYAEGIDNFHFRFVVLKNNVSCKKNLSICVDKMNNLSVIR